MNEKLQEFNRSLKTSKIAIIGVGVSNIPLIEYLVNLKCDITLYDKKNKELLGDDIKNIISKYNIKGFWGDDYLENLMGFDIIFRSPSCLPTNKYIKKEIDRGCIVTTEVEQVIRLAPCKVIGVTGSKGKTTTTTIIYNILKSLGYSTYLGGNIGTPLFVELDKMKNDDIVVLELSSFQLMDMKVSPSISVVTNISPDHLDVHSSYDEYINAKKYIFSNQEKQDVLVLNHDDEIVKNFYCDTIGEVRYFGIFDKTEDWNKNSYVLNGRYIEYNDEKIIDTKKLLLKGVHNYLNVCAALNAIKDYIDVSNDVLEEIVASIAGVAHRLEFVREINGVEWYNDSSSTTPDKYIAGIRAFDSKVVLIAGGYDKNISYESLAKPILDNVSKLILFGDTKNKIYDAVMKLSRDSGVSIPIYVMDTLEEVIDVAYQVSVPGEVVLFSPASASFDMFKNAYQRGDLFKEIVNKL